MTSFALKVRLPPLEQANMNEAASGSEGVPGILTAPTFDAPSLPAPLEPQLKARFM